MLGFNTVPPALWILTGTLFVCFLFKRFLTSPSSSKPQPPGPRGIDAVMSIMRGVRYGSFHLEISTWAPRGTPVTMCKGPFANFVSINNPGLVREVFAGRYTEAATSDRPPTFIGSFLFYGTKDIAMAPVTPSWNAQRKMFHSALRLYGDGVQRFESTVQGELTNMIEQLEKCQGVNVCLEEHISHTLLCVLSILLTGERPGPDSPLPLVMRDLDKAVSTMGTLSVDLPLQLFPALRHLPGWYRDRCDLTLQCRDKLIEPIVAHAKATLCRDQPRGIVDAMLLAQEGFKEDHVTDEHVKGAILDIIVGGYVTSLTSFLSTVLVLLNLPHVARAIQTEIDSAVGQRAPTLDDRKDLHYTEAAILEMLRYMRFFALGLPHVCSEDIDIGPYHIAKGTTLVANQWECNMDPTAWVQPERFLPERFLDKEGKLLPADHPTRKNLLPFGIGKRTCPGETFARTRLFLLISTLLQRFDFLPPSNGRVIPLDDIPWTPGAVLLLPSYTCRVQKRTH